MSYDYQNGRPLNWTRRENKTSPKFDLFFVRSLAAPTTLSVDAVLDADTITVTAPAGFVIGSYLGVFGGGRYYFATVLNVAGSVLTLDTQIDFPFTAGSTVARLSRDLNVNGSAARYTFSISGPTAGAVAFDISRFMLVAECANPVDLSKFADQTALTRGLVLRKNDGKVHNIWNIKDNSGFAAHAYDWTPYAATNPQQGVDGMNVRYTFSAEDKHDSFARVAAGESLDLVVQDNLSGITLLQAIAEGSEVIR
jgi:hypothetical protein